MGSSYKVCLHIGTTSEHELEELIKEFHKTIEDSNSSLVLSTHYTEADTFLEDEEASYTINLNKSEALEIWETLRDTSVSLDDRLEKPRRGTQVKALLHRQSRIKSVLGKIIELIG